MSENEGGFEKKVLNDLQVNANMLKKAQNRMNLKNVLKKDSNPLISELDKVHKQIKDKMDTEDLSKNRGFKDPTTTKKSSINREVLNAFNDASIMKNNANNNNTTIDYARRVASTTPSSPK